MLYVFYGNNINKVRDRARGVISLLKQKRPTATYVEIENEVSSSALEEYSQSQGLFFESALILLDGILKKAESRENFLKKIDELKESKNIFILLETDKIPAEILRKLELKAKKIEEHNLFSNKNTNNFDNFILADALGNRDKKKLWTLFLKKTKDGVATEEIAGIFFWQLKSIYLAQASKSITESGLKPSVFTKAKKFSKNFNLPEIKNLIFELSEIYHNDRRGKLKMEIGLERFILERV